MTFDATAEGVDGVMATLAAAIAEIRELRRALTNEHDEVVRSRTTLAAAEKEARDLRELIDRKASQAAAAEAHLRVALQRQVEGRRTDKSNATAAQTGMQQAIDDLTRASELATLRDEIAHDLLSAARSARRGADPTPGRSGVESGPDIAHELPEQLFFDEAFYLDHNPDLHSVVSNLLLHYVETGWREGRNPCALFDGDWYLARYVEARVSGLCPLSHYVRHGAAERLQPHPCFDRPFYEGRYPQALKLSPDVFQHFVRQGLQAGCYPSARVEALAHGKPAVDVLSKLLGGDLRPNEAATWPPRPLDDYWLPQALRDYVVDEFGPQPIDLLSYLFSVIAKFESRPDTFETSESLAALKRRARASCRRRSGFLPNVSIVIPVYNNLVYTLTCVVSILEHDTSQRFEIIIGDDGSTDATPDVFSRLGDCVTLVRHDANKGFLGNCNACAERARGRILVFLNNDTLVLPGWLDELVAPLADGSDIGLTGSKLVNGDGTLQEAGGIMWDDGSAWNYGRGSDPRLPHFSYAKEVDYCSGASVAISKILWDDLGGFDTTFAPAYCEDSDLAFRVRAAGARTWLAASSVLIHHEGRSHGSDVATGIKAYQEVNQEKFRERWRAVLARDHLPNATDVVVARDRSRDKPHILVIDHYIPQWDRDAGSRTMLHFIRMFHAQGFHVTFWPDNLYHDRTYAKVLQDLGVEVIYGPQYVDRFKAWYDGVDGFYGYVLLSRPQIAEKYIGMIDRRRCRVLYYGHDLHWKRLEKQWAVLNDEDLRREMEAMRGLEYRICRQSDAVLYPSTDEVAVITADLPEIPPAIAVPAWCFDHAELGSMRSRLDVGAGRDAMHVMFVGGFGHSPNVDGVLWFVDEVWPLIKQQLPGARVTIAGSNPPETVRSLAARDASISVVGHISDVALDRLYRQATVAVVPLRFGGGVKGKVIEAFAKGIPVVSTPTGMQGIAGAETIACIAESPEGFAEEVLACLAGAEPVWAKVRAAMEFLARSYSVDVLVASLLPAVPDLGRRSIRARHDDGPRLNDGDQRRANLAS